MSLLNVWVSSELALVAVDTQAEIGGGACLDVSKLIAFPAQKLVLACRGDLLLFNALLAFVHGSGAEIDALAGSLPVMADHTVTQMTQSMAAPIGGYRFHEAEFALVGWSEERRRVAGVAVVRMPGESRFTASEIDPWRIGPNAGWSSLPAMPDCAENMEAIAREQVRYMRTHHPAAPMGGRLLLAEISSDGVTLSQLASLS